MTTVKEIADEIVALQSRKNADYGNAFGISMQEFGLTAPAIRLTDKLNRFKSLIKRDAEVKTESIEDTLIDLAAYAMMTVVEMRNQSVMPRPKYNEPRLIIDNGEFHNPKRISIGLEVIVVDNHYSQYGQCGSVVDCHEANNSVRVSFNNGELATFPCEAVKRTIRFPEEILKEIRMGDSVKFKTSRGNIEEAEFMGWYPDGDLRVLLKNSNDLTTFVHPQEVLAVIHKD